VRTHPETGRKALYVNVAHTLRFKDMTEAESAPILNYLFHHQTKPEFTCRFSWRVGPMVLWDNRCVLHNPGNDYNGYRRVMHRVTLRGRSAAVIRFSLARISFNDDEWRPRTRHDRGRQDRHPGAVPQSGDLRD
jgi:hypothetical protein